MQAPFTTDVRCFSQSDSLLGQSQRGHFPYKHQQEPQIPIIPNEVLVGSVVASDISEESPVRLSRTFTVRNAFYAASNSQHVHYTLIHHRSSLVTCLQVFQNYSPSGDTKTMEYF